MPQDKLMIPNHNLINDTCIDPLIKKQLKSGVMIEVKYKKTAKGYHNKERSSLIKKLK